MYVDALSEGSRTRVRFPPPPPFLKREALDIQGLFVFWVDLKLGFQTVSSNILVESISELRSYDLTIQTLSCVMASSSCNQFLTGSTKKCRLQLVIDRGVYSEPVSDKKRYWRSIF